MINPGTQSIVPEHWVGKNNYSWNGICSLNRYRKPTHQPIGVNSIKVATYRCKKCKKNVTPRSLRSSLVHNSLFDFTLLVSDYPLADEELRQDAPDNFLSADLSCSTTSPDWWYDIQLDPRWGGWWERLVKQPSLPWRGRCAIVPSIV